MIVHVWLNIDGCDMRKLDSCLKNANEGNCWCTKILSDAEEKGVYGYKYWCRISLI